MPERFPTWVYFPLNQVPPGWAQSLVDVVAGVPQISTAKTRTGLSSDAVLGALAPGLVALGYDVEAGKKAGAKVRRPVLFGENGRNELEFQIDAFHDGEGIVLEVEAGRGAKGNAAYRDLLRTGLIVNARNLALLLPVAYRFGKSREVTAKAYDECSSLLRAVYASQRLRLPFDGVLLIGY